MMGTAKQPQQETKKTKTPDIFLRVPGEVRDKVTEDAKKLAEEQRKLREQEREDAAKKRKEEREAQDREQAEQREQTKALKRDADLADKYMKVALDGYREIERAVKPEERETARQSAAEALRKMNSADQAVRAAQERFAEAKREHERARAEFDKLMAVHMHEVPTAKAKLATAWEANEIAWSKVAVPYRKEHRDRRLKNEVKDVLGLKGGEE